MILIVDDNEDLRDTYKGMINLEDGIHEAEDGFDAWEKISNNKYDVILCDYRMPNCDGIAFAKALRQKETPNKDTPILFITAFLGDLDDKSRTLPNIFFLRKPLKPKQLTRMIRIVTEGKVNPLDEGAA